jgi:hypothetical protein
MLLADIEGDVSWLFQEAGVDEDEPTNVVELAQRCLGGVDRVRFVSARHLYRDSDFRVIDGHPTIFVKDGLPLVRMYFGVAHELGEYRQYRRGHRGEDGEMLANLIGAGVLAPRRAVQAAVHLGMTLKDMAAGFHITQTCAALRLGEATGRPVAVVAPKGVRIRGEEWGWPDEHTIRRLGEIAVPQLHRLEITDAPMRFALLAWQPGE